MKKIILVLSMLLISSIAQASCIAEIVSVSQDVGRGSIVVETKYTLNGSVVQTGRTRYLETSGTKLEIVQKAKDDIKGHCENLIKRIATNRSYLNSQKLKRQKELTSILITELQPVVGFKSTTLEVVDTFKGKDIKVTYDSKNTIIDTP